MLLPIVALIFGFVFGVRAEQFMHRRWRNMYMRGEAECWRCHGSGKERNQ